MNDTPKIKDLEYSPESYFATARVLYRFENPHVSESDLSVCRYVHRRLKGKPYTRPMRRNMYRAVLSIHRAHQSMVTEFKL